MPIRRGKRCSPALRRPALALGSRNSPLPQAFPAILHGLMHLWDDLQAIVDTLLDSDATAVAGYGARFCWRGVPGRDAHGQRVEGRPPPGDVVAPS